MFEPRTIVVDPPRPIWIRVPARSKRSTDMAHPGLLWAWATLWEWGAQQWTGSVSLLDDPARWWVHASNIRPRDE